MGFERPWMLLGGLAALIPIVIHLIDRAKARRVPFAALEFLFLSDQRLARRLKLRQLMVLALRVMLIVAIAFAFAKPYVAPEGVPESIASQPGAVVLIIDDSASMGATPEGGDASMLSVAIDRARDMVKDAGAQTRFALVTGSQPARRLTRGLTFDRAELQRALSTLRPKPRAGDLAGALRDAERLLAEVDDVPESMRHVVVLSDHTATAWEGIAKPWSLERVPKTQLVDVRSAAKIDNTAITGVEVRLTPDEKRSRAEVSVALRNFGSTLAAGTLVVEVAGETFRSEVAVAPGQSETIRLTGDVALDRIAGGRGVARLEIVDALALDNRWFFTLNAGGAASVALFNGAPRTTAFLDELFFVRAATTPDDGEIPSIRPTVHSPDEITKAPLDAYDAVVLANVGRLSAAQSMTLDNYVQRGGSLLVTAGDHLDPDAARSYGNLLPAPIRGLKYVVKRDDPSAALKALTIGQVDGEHPAVEQFVTVDDVSLFKARVFAYALVDSKRSGASVVMSLSGGVPLLLEKSLGRGRTMFLATSIDRDWTDLPIRTSYVPLLQQTLLYLSGRLEQARLGESHVGEPVSVPVPDGRSDASLLRPDGEVQKFQVGARTSLQVLKTDAVGHYEMFRTDTKQRQVFAVNALRSESDFSPAERNFIEKLLLQPGLNASPSPTDNASVAALPPNRTKVWPFVLVMLFVLLASEAWLVLRGG